MLSESIRGNIVENVKKQITDMKSMVTQHNGNSLLIPTKSTISPRWSKFRNSNHGKNKANSNQAIKFKGRYLTSSLDISNGFVKKYSSIVQHVSSKTSKEIKKNNLDNPSSFMTQQTAEAMKACKASKAAGPDNISNLHLKHLGPNGLEYLTKIFHLSMATSIIPDIWKSSVIIPLLKPGKNPQ